jgi:hypothetical protein
MCMCMMSFTKFTNLYLWLYSPFLDFGRLFSFLILYAVDRTPWTGDNPFARPLPTHRRTQTQKKRTHSHPCFEWDSNPRPQCSVNEDSSSLTPRGHCDRLFHIVFFEIPVCIYMYIRSRRYNSLHSFWPLTILGKPSVRTSKWWKEAIKFSTRFGRCVQSVSVQQCGGLRCLFVPIQMLKHHTVRAEKLSQTCVIL